MGKMILATPEGMVVQDGRTLAEAKDERLAMVREEAGRRIVEIAPDFKQRNLTARAAELALRVAVGGPALTPDELAEIAAGQGVWNTIKAIRVASNAAEVAILAATTNDEADLVEPVWP